MGDAVAMPTMSALNFRFAMTIDLDNDLDALFASFGRVPADDEIVGDSVAIELTHAADEFFELHIGGDLAFRTLDLGVLVHQTVWVITRRGVETRPDAVVLHAAAVIVDGVHLLVSGRSGAGKSTTTARMVGDGAAYLTDEAVVIEPGGRVGAAIRRPLHLNGDSLEMLGLDSRAIVHLPDGSGYIPAADSTLGERRDGDDAVGILLLENLAGDLVVREPRRSELAVALIRESFHGAATSQHGLEIVKELSIRADCLALSGGTVAARANAGIIVAQCANEIAPARWAAYHPSSGQLRKRRQ